MSRSFSRVVRVGGWLALAAGLSPANGQVPAGWALADVGGATPPGSGTVTDQGAWTLKGGGTGVAGKADQFYLAYRDLAGDGSLIARVVTGDGGDPTEGRAGLMIRESDAPGARNLFVGQTSGRGVVVTLRPEKDALTQELGQDLVPAAQSGGLRLQRSGNEVQAFFSQDGQLWWALAGPRTLNLAGTVRVGLAVTGQAADKPATVTFDSVSVEQRAAVSPTGLTACGGNLSALLTWRTVPKAVSYLVWRGALDATADRLTRLTDEPITTTSFTDNTGAVKNGTPVLYAVSPVFKEADGSLREGMLTVTATVPTDAPGLQACSVAEPPGAPGRVTFDANSGTITLTGTGPALGGRTDRCFFAARSFQGDFQVTVKLLKQASPLGGQRVRPSRPSDRSVPVSDPIPAIEPESVFAGLMVRESLEPGARFFSALVSPADGAGLIWRGVADEPTTDPGEALIDRDRVPTPLWLRLTRAGNTLTAAVSSDGRVYRPFGEPYPFADNLTGSLYVGLALSGASPARPGRAQFTEFTIKPK